MPSIENLAAKLVDFGGWEMPIAYPSGTVAEHNACRNNAVAFDVSHLGTVRLRGADSFEVLQRCLTNDLGKIGPGRAQYTHLLDEAGSVVDDIIVWWVDDETFDVMPNASNTQTRYRCNWWHRCNCRARHHRRAGPQGSSCS